MADLGETILNTLKFAAGGEGEVQQRVLNKQTIDANQRVLDKERDKQVAGLIDGTELSQFIIKSDPSDRSKPLRSFDVVNAYAKSPEVMVEFLNTVPESLLNAQDEKGNTINVKVKGIRPVLVEDQEMFAVEVVRPDGKVAPLTRRGTSSPDDNVILMSRDDLNGLATQRVVSMMNNGAFDNSSTFLREMTDLQDAIGMDNARKEQALRDKVDLMLENDPERFGVAERREIYEMFSQLEGDELLQAVADMGIDIDAVFEEYNAKRAAEGEAPTEVSDPARDTTGLGNSETMLGDLSKAVSGLGAFAKNPVGTVNDIFGLRAITGTPSAAPVSPSAETQAAEAEFQQLALELQKEKAETGYATSSRITQLTKARDEAAKKFFAAQSADAAAAAAPSAATPAKPIGAFDPGANNSFKKAVDAGIAAINPQIEALRQRATGAAPVDSSQSTISPEIMSAPAEVQEAILGEGLSPEERRAAILGALETTLAKPTGKATEYVRDYMIKNGYTSPESLSNAPSAEVMNIAFTIAANADVATTADRLNIAQSLLNFAQFGNTETSALDVAKLQQARTGDSIAAQRLNFDMWKENNNLDAAETKFADEVYQEAAARAEKIRKAITTKPRMFWQKNPLPAEAVDEFREVMNRAQTEPNATRRAAYQTVAGEIMPEVLAAFIISEPPSGIKEAITGPFEDFWLRAPYRQLNTDFGDFRLSYKDDGVTPEFMFLVTPKGDDAEGGQINMLQLTGMFGRETRDFILSAIEKTAELKNAPN